MSKRVFIFIPGIFTFPGDSHNWDGKAVTHTMTRPDSEDRAEKVEILVGPISRAFCQKARATKLYHTISYWRGWDISLVGHSNGADVICDVLSSYAGTIPHISRVHLVCGVCEDDFNLNGLNTALEKGIVSDVVAYVAGNDSVIRWASTWVGRMLDYGDMGLYGATNVNAAVSGRVRVVDTGSWEDYGHSTCWSDDEFCGTMATILA